MQPFLASMGGLTTTQRAWKPARRIERSVGITAFALLLTACGGGGSDGSGGGSPSNAPPSLSVSLRAPARIALAEGSVAFSLSRSPAAGEQLSCTLNGSAASPCHVAGADGQVHYNGLATGLHRVEVEVRDANGARLAKSEQVIELVEPKVVVFGATPAGIAASIAAARAGHPVVLLEPTRWVGGMTSGGLTKTDLGNRGHEILGGLAIEFYKRLRTVEIEKGACAANACIGLYDHESNEAERLFETMLTEARVVVERSVALSDVTKAGAKITSLQTSRGEIRGEVFIDASYEGDLMARAAVPYRVGREARVLANPPDDAEQLALQEDDAGVLRYRGPLGLFVDPYKVPGDPSSGTLPYVEPRPPVIPTVGDADSTVMAYTYRLCVTDDPGNRVPFERPDGYDPLDYEAHARVAQAWAAKGVDLGVSMFNPAQTVLSADRSHFKYDLNGGSTFSIDMTGPGLNHAYVEASDAEREQIRNAYRQYIRGLLYFWRTDPRFGNLNAKIERFGYCKDEFVDRDGWPHQLYVRTSRRMVGEYVMNENDVMQNGRRPQIVDSVGFGAYNVDVHMHRYLAAPLTWPDGVRRDALVHEGFLIVHAPDDAPWPISYRSLIPQAAHATNFLNPVTVSATYLAYSAIRMEPTMMILGEAAGTAAAIAIEQYQDVQAVDYGLLRQRLLANGQTLPN